MSLYIRTYLHMYFGYVSLKNLKKIYSTIREHALFNKQAAKLWFCRECNDDLRTILNQNLLIILPSLIFQRQSLFRTYSTQKITEKVTDFFPLSNLKTENLAVYLIKHCKRFVI